MTSSQYSYVLSESRERKIGKSLSPPVPKPPFDPCTQRQEKKRDREKERESKKKKRGAENNKTSLEIAGVSVSARVLPGDDYWRCCLPEMSKRSRISFLRFWVDAKIMLFNSIHNVLHYNSVLILMGNTK